MEKQEILVERERQEVQARLCKEESKTMEYLTSRCEKVGKWEGNLKKFMNLDEETIE